MNRIYQGRVKRLDVLNDTKDAQAIASYEEDKLKREDDNPLWKHHCIFQDAVNYYIVALSALADPKHAKGDRVVGDLRKRVEEAWEHFPRSVEGSARSFRDSLTPWLALSPGSNLEDAYDCILKGNEAKPEVLVGALKEFLETNEMKKGEVRNASKNIEWFVFKNHNKNYPLSTGVLLKDWATPRIPVWIYETDGDRNCEKLRTGLRPEYFSKLNASSPYLTGDKAKAALKKRVEEFDFGENSSLKNRLLEKVYSLAEDFSFPSPAAGALKGNANITFSAFCFFKYLEADKDTFNLLDSCFKQPKKQEIEKFGGSMEQAPNGSIESLLEKARGTRGYIFPAFTSLSGWEKVESGSWNWKGFDINAFEEALKSLNQFNNKTTEREEKQSDLSGRIAMMLGSPISGWKPKSSESEEGQSALEPLDEELFKLARKLEMQLTADLSETVLGGVKVVKFVKPEYQYRAGEWNISRASLRGFREIAEDWNKVYLKHNKSPSKEELEKIVKDYQRDEKNKKTVGSLPLFLTLCEPEYWPLWLGDTTDSDGGETVPYNKFLFDMVDFHATVRDWERSQEPIKLTPAEAKHSRRLYMFSDVTDKKAKVELCTGEDGKAYAQCAIALRGADNTVKEQRVRLHYSAPRLLRDELLGGESRWLQPMMKGLGLEPPEPEKKNFDSAVSLMPDYGRSKHGQPGDLRMLLNFPVTLDSEWLHKEIGKSAIWRGQFNGTKRGQFNGTKDKNLHLHWPKTAKDACKKNPWWENSVIIENGFTTLSVDLGQRSAGAWALIRVTCWNPSYKNAGIKRPVREIGNDGKRNWWAEVLSVGMLRLPGEDQKVQGSNGIFNTEHFGKAGRNALESEYKEAIDIAKSLHAAHPENWVGKTCDERSFPEQNDALIALANRRLSRLNTFHRWSCFDPERSEVADRKGKLIEKLKEELSHWQDENVKQLKLLIEDSAYEEFRKAAGTAFCELREELGQQLVAIANRTAPLRDRSWEWKERKDDPRYHELLDTGPQLKESKSWIRGQRGLSMQRLEQLEKLRRLFLRHNRSFDREPGKPACFGFADRGRNSGEPCQPLLDKIERMKEQRINQTAHLILEKALGVRLKVHSTPKSERKKRDIHGEYEKISNRQPVDLIVIENLDRYLTSQGRGPSENSRLMKWAHRAVRDKIKMLAEEPFGIPVVETAAAYSSRFSCRTSVAGARLEERPSLDEYLSDSFNRRATRTHKQGQPAPASYKTLIEQFSRLKMLNDQSKEKTEAEGKTPSPPKTLFIPKVGGPLFLALDEARPSQADMNAAVNLGLRAIAAPESLHLIHKVRTEKNGESFIAKHGKPANAREEAVFTNKSTISLKDEPCAKLKSSRAPNFFYDAQNTAIFDRGNLKINETQLPVASGVGLWTTVNEKSLEQIVHINEERLKKWNAPLVPSTMVEDTDGEIPM